MDEMERKYGKAICDYMRAGFDDFYEQERYVQKVMARGRAILAGDKLPHGWAAMPWPYPEPVQDVVEFESPRELTTQEFHAFMGWPPYVGEALELPSGTVTVTGVDQETGTITVDSEPSP